jgi:hypothetical protein
MVDFDEQHGYPQAKRCDLVKVAFGQTLDQPM